MERFQFADELTKPVKSALAVSACHALCYLYQDKHLRKYACHTKCEGSMPMSSFRSLTGVFMQLCMKF